MVQGACDVNWGKLFLLITNCGKICISPSFFIPFQSFFPPTCYLAIFKTEKYTPLFVYCEFVLGEGNTMTSSKRGEIRTFQRMFFFDRQTDRHYGS